LRQLDGKKDSLAQNANTTNTGLIKGTALSAQIAGATYQCEQEP